MISDPMERHRRLLFNRLHWNETHIGALHGLTTGFCICSIVLIGLYIRTNKLRWHQSNIVPKPRDFPSPMMSARSRFEPDETSWKLRKQLQEALPRDFSFEDCLACAIDRVDLEVPLRNVDPNYLDIHLILLPWIGAAYSAPAVEGRPSHHVVTDQAAGDTSQVEPLLDQIEMPIGQFTADGAYDGNPTYQVVARHSADAAVVIPPRSSALERPNSHPRVSETVISRRSTPMEE
jgi:hypothetical protein